MVYENCSMQNESINYAKQALSAFLNKPAHDISCQLLKGGSEEASLIKATYSNKSYVIKLFSDNDLGKNEIVWTHHADTLGIGPKLYYADTAGKFMITQFVDGEPLTPCIANNSEVIKNIAHATSVLHNSSLSSVKKSDMFDRIDDKYKKLQCSGRLKNMVEQYKTNAERIKDLLHDFPVTAVPCHNDLNPGNIYVHDNVITLIDWGDSALSNPYYDIAAFFILNNIEKQSTLLFFEEYNPQLLTPEFQKRFKLYMRLVYLEFALNLLLGVQAQNSALLDSQDIPEVKNVTDYLTLLAEREVIIDSLFLYHMAIASIKEMMSNC